ncbi:MAG: histone [Pseudobutyrivibrio sp.]|nr:histone [Pseudobutyrivibrio sp.]
MATNAKVSVEDVKKAAAEAAKTVEKVATEAKKEATVKTTTAAKAAKATATKKATAVKKTATKAATKAVAKAKKAVVKTAVVQYQGIEFTMDEAIKKAEAGFKKDYKKKAIEEISVYVKPEERKIYYVVNGDCVGSVDL